MKKLDINKTTKNFISLWSEVHTNKFRLFITQTMLHWNIIFLVADASLNNYELTFEAICKKITHRVGSRSSIQNVLKNCELAGYTYKEISKNDKRAKNYYLTKFAMKEFNSLVTMDANNFVYQ